MPGQSLWNPARERDISDDKNRVVRFAKPDTPILAGMRIKMNLGKT
jgi:hypothetical protein